MYNNARTSNMSLLDPNTLLNNDHVFVMMNTETHRIVGVYSYKPTCDSDIHEVQGPFYVKKNLHNKIPTIEVNDNVAIPQIRRRRTFGEKDFFY